MSTQPTDDESQIRAAFENYCRSFGWSEGRLARWHVDDESLPPAWSGAYMIGSVQQMWQSWCAGAKWGTPTPSGEAEPQWLPLTPELLTAIESGDHGARFWVVSKWLSEPEIGEYEWRQGQGPHGFNTQDSRFGADEVTHVLPYKAPPMPAARKEGNNP